MKKNEKKRERDAAHAAARRRANLRKSPAEGTAAPRCGLCGKRGRLVRTECCGQWICDDEHKYKLFSYATNSCSRNHRRYTLCGAHFTEGHPGDWKTCSKCREMVETEMYVWYGTNEYNFEKLENPPAYEPTRCRTCGKIIVLSEGGYSLDSEGYCCARCMGS